MCFGIYYSYFNKISLVSYSIQRSCSLNMLVSWKNMCISIKRCYNCVINAYFYIRGKINYDILYKDSI